MKVLKSILSESKTYYLDTKKKIEGKLKSLPKGIVKKREIGGRIYYYLQYREGAKIVQKYIGKAKPEIMLKQIKERKSLKAELKKVIEALKIIRRSEGRKR
jgi:hypothetical protein